MCAPSTRVPFDVYQAISSGSVTPAIVNDALVSPSKTNTIPAYGPSST